MELHKATAGDGLMLVYSRAPRNMPLTMGAILVVAAIAFLAFLRLFPGGGLLLGILATVGAVVAIGVARMPYATRVVTDFDNAARQIKVTTFTRSEGPEQSMSASFDEVRTLQLFQQRAKATQTQTLTLILRDGRTVFLGQERQRSDWFQPPFTAGLADLVRRIREETGVGEAEGLPLPIRAAGAFMGIARK